MTKISGSQKVSLVKIKLQATLSIFSRVCWPSVCLLWRNVCLGFSPIFDCVICFSRTELHELQYILETNTLSVILFAINFSHSKGCPLILFVSFIVQKLLSLIKSHLYISILLLFFFPLLQEVAQRGSCYDVRQRLYCWCFPLRALQ